MRQSMTEPLLSIWASLINLVGCGFQFEKEQDIVESKQGG